MKQILLLITGLFYFSLNANAQSMLTSPNGGEVLQPGTIHNITWVVDTPIVLVVSLEYSIDSGSTWNLIVANTSNSGNYSWTVPNTPSEKCLVHFWGAGDVSDSVFTIDNSSGINTLSNSDKITLLPNPAFGDFAINIQGNIPVESVTLLDITGKLVWIKTFDVNSLISKHKFDISNLPSGVYFASVQSEGNNYRKKLVVTH